MLRLFLALEANDAVQEAVAAAQRTLRRRGDLPVRWTNPGQSHLTLQFFGNVVAEHLPALAEAVQPAVAPFAPLLLREGALGAFPDTDAPRVLWLGLRGDVPELRAMQHALAAAVATVAGVVADRKPFNAHLTLGRVESGRRDTGGVRAVAEAIARPVAVPPVAWPIGHVALVRSVLGAGGSRYTTLMTFPLTGTR